MAKPEPDLPLTINRQYLKDLSFENPNAPEVYRDLADDPPEISVAMDVAPILIGERSYEIVLSLRATARRKDGTVAFLVDVHYAGLAKLGPSVPKDEVESLVFVEAPRHLFPFARAILALVVRDGGYAPLFMNPIDFRHYYEKHKKNTLPGPSAAPVTAPDGAGGGGAEGTPLSATAAKWDS